MSVQVRLMFITHSKNKHPFSHIYAETGMTVWTAIEVELRRAFYLVEVSEAIEDASECTVTRTVMLTRGNDALDLYQQGGLDGVTPKSISLITPTESKQGNAWCIDILTEVWEADEPDEPKAKAKIFAKASGGYFVDSPTHTSIDKLKNWRSIAKL